MQVIRLCIDLVMFHTLVIEIQQQGFAKLQDALLFEISPECKQD